MRRKAIFLFLIFLFFACFYYYKHQTNQKEIAQSTMKLTSPVFKNQTLIPARYTCDGENINPPLLISQVPDSAQSLVLIVDDPDAPVGDWVHWLVWNIPAETKEIREGEKIEGAVEGFNDFHQQAYGGPCPPGGTHHYHFKLYALDQLLNLPATASKEELLKAMSGHIIDRDVLVGLYQRQ